MKVPNPALGRLHAKGLVTSPAFPADHVAFPDGVIVGKPASVRGNSLPGYESGWGGSRILVDAPVIYLHSNGAQWFVTSVQAEPGPAPGDFVDTWSTAEEAVLDVLDYYFGDPRRMQAQK